jgi:hypothetical protein
MPRQPPEDKSSHSRSPGFTGAIVLVLLGLYIAAYFSLVSRIVPSSITWVPSPPTSLSPALPGTATRRGIDFPYIEVEPLYTVPAGIPQTLPQLVFYPAYQIDHWLRPDYWSFADAPAATPVPPPPGSP